MNVLSPAETAVAKILITGQKTTEIAHQLCVTESTIKAHITSIYKKLRVKNRKEFMALGESL